ncbi:hypothetical protein [Dysgonomonas sp. HGC4]|nr:hypothetical protein [Dysgonomonas sp. HGC4]MBD8346476.1 hypothetical protein [Dysgonomonas sp. HGC4]
MAQLCQAMVCSDYMSLPFLTSINKNKLTKTDKKKIVMRKMFLFISCLLLVGLLNAQVGINTKVPLGVFHLDGKGNTSASPIDAELRDDVIMIASNNGGINVSIGGLPKLGASLSLDSPNKAFLPNRVPLTGLYDQTTVANPRKSMIVYNTAEAGTVPANVTPGYYMYDGASWVRLSTTAYSRFVKTLGLKANVATKASSVINYATSSVLNFGDLTIYESGSYAYTFQLSGTTDTHTQFLMGATYHLYIMRKRFNDAAYTVADYAEITLPVYATGENVTTSITLGCIAKVGDNIQIRVGHGGTIPRVWTLAKDMTTLMYWKL